MGCNAMSTCKCSTDASKGRNHQGIVQGHALDYFTLNINSLRSSKSPGTPLSAGHVMKEHTLGVSCSFNKLPS